MPTHLPAAAPLAPDALQRCHRPLILPEVGDEGQRRPKSARVLLVDALCMRLRFRTIVVMGADASDREDEITPRVLACRLARGLRPILIDVREPYEWTIARLPDARLVPLDTLPEVVPTLDRASELVVYCHLGTRSATAVEWLREQGFARARNLSGGIDRWSSEVDPSTRRY
jgi:rhodanese-related sulfurtransferase